MNLSARILTSIGATESSTYREFLRELGDDCPEPGDKPAWGELLRTVEALERTGLVDVERRDGRIESLQLTALGAERAREALQER